MDLDSGGNPYELWQWELQMGMGMICRIIMHILMGRVGRFSVGLRGCTI